MKMETRIAGTHARATHKALFAFSFFAVFFAFFLSFKLIQALFG